MRVLLLKMLFSMMVTLLILVTMFTSLVGHVSNDGIMGPGVPLPKQSPPLCVGCRALLSSECQGFTKAVVTKNNTPVGTKIAFDGEKRSISVTSAIFSTFAERSPFSKKIWDTCSVVGNGGILIDSNCGKMIDSAQMVIRCNLPPVLNSFLKDVGSKTDIVTANPSILTDKYAKLQERRRPFMDKLRCYNDSLLLLPAFSYGQNTAVCLRALYTIQDFESPIKPLFLNPEYLRSLAHFWRVQGLKEVRLSSGLMVTSLALELCSDVHLYGFWPFDEHPDRNVTLPNHYYDNQQSKKRVHAMPAEFDYLFKLHTQGILKLHLGECRGSDQ